MKKLAIVLTLALVLVGAFAAVALADPSHYTSPVTENSVWLTAEPTSYPVTGGAQPYIPADPTTGASIAIHSNYTANTDACSSCHSAHYAQDVEAEGTGFTTNLLQATDPSLLCITCHDGTLASTYNVMAGTFNATDNSKTYRNGAGLFAVSYDGAANVVATSASQHDVFGGVALTSAPGGIGANAKNAADTAAWSGTLECTSCHDPHGSGGNPRLLTPNPNGVMTQIKGVTMSGTYTAATDNGVTRYYFKASNANSQLPVNGGSYAPAKMLPEISDLTRPNTVNNRVKLNVYIGGTLVTASGKGPYSVSYDPTQGYYLLITDTAHSGAVTVDYEPVLIVNGTVASKLTSTEKETGFDKTLAGFCGSCHVSFAGGRTVKDASGNNQVNLGMYTGDGHHQADLGNAGKNPVTVYGFYQETSCATCHASHGVDKQYWMDQTRNGLFTFNKVQAYTDALTAAGFAKYALGTVAPADTAGTFTTADANNPFAQGELAGKSQIKKLPNMGICESCHTKGLHSASPNNIY